VLVEALVESPLVEFGCVESDFGEPVSPALVEFAERAGPPGAGFSGVAAFEQLGITFR
jgi:hypothetical protein